MGTLPRSRSSTLKKKKDLSVDEGTALNDMHKRVSSIGCVLDPDKGWPAMEAHYCDCIIEGGLLTHAMEAHYCDCISPL